LSVITVVAAICVPIVLIYQGCSYHVFRARLGGEPSGGEPVEAAQPRVAGSPTG